MKKFNQNNFPYSLSVIIPNRNDGKYLKKCIQSVLEQDIPPDELIIIDDESTDNSVEVIRSAISGCSFAKLYINENNLGAVENSSRGLSLATSKYIFFLGANDFILPGLFRRTKECLEKFPAGLWSAMVWKVDEADNYIGMHPSPVIALVDSYFSPDKCRKMMFSFGNWLTGQTTVYRREALIEVGGFDPALKGLNDLLAAHVVASRYGASFSPAPLGVMRIHQGAFLTETLGNILVLENILTEVMVRGHQKEPALFTKNMLHRTKLRFYFASLRVTGGATTAHIQGKMGPVRRLLLRLTQYVPSFLSAVKIWLYFLIMRPFDMVPTIFYRVMGSIIVRVIYKLKMIDPRQK